MKISQIRSLVRSILLEANDPVEELIQSYFSTKDESFLPVIHDALLENSSVLHAARKLIEICLESEKLTVGRNGLGQTTIAPPAEVPQAVNSFWSRAAKALEKLSFMGVTCQQIPKYSPDGPGSLDLFEETILSFKGPITGNVSFVGDTFVVRLWSN